MLRLPILAVVVALIGAPAVAADVATASDGAINRLSVMIEGNGTVLNMLPGVPTREPKVGRLGTETDYVAAEGDVARVFTGLQVTVEAYHANEGVISVRLALSHTTLSGMDEMPASSNPQAMVQLPRVQTLAEEPGRWVHLRGGEPAIIEIGDDHVTLKAF